MGDQLITRGLLRWEGREVALFEEICLGEIAKG